MTDAAPMTSGELLKVTSQMPSNASGTSAIALATWVGIGAGAVIIAAYVWISGDVTRRVFNSDILLPVAFMQEAFAHPEMVSQFQLPRIPSVFPDLVTYAALSTVVSDFRWALFAYSALQITAFVFVSTHLVSTAALVPSRIAGAAIISLLVGMFTVDTASEPIAHHYTLFTMVEHFSSFLNTVLAFVILQRCLAEPTYFRWIAALIAICFLASLSNKLFVATFAVPASITVIVIWRRRRSATSKSLFIIGCIAFAVSAGLLATNLLNLEPQQRVIIGTLRPAQFLAAFWNAATAAPATYASTVIIPCLYFLAVPGIHRKRFDDTPALRDVWTFAALSTAASIIATAALFSGDVGSFRYLAAFYFWPLIFVAVSISLWSDSPQKSISVLVAAVVSCTALLVATISETSNFRAWRDPLADCLMREKDRLNLKAGLADYWHSRTAMLGSNGKLQVEQMIAGWPHLWGNNPYWFTHDRTRPADPPHYNFIVPGSNSTLTRQKFGAPDRVETCDGHQIWFYDDEQALLRAATNYDVARQ